MNPPPGSFPLSNTGASSRRRRRRLIPLSQPRDRLSPSNISPRKIANRSSIPDSRPASTMIYDPDIATTGWEIYRDPLEENESIIRADQQQRGGSVSATRSTRRSARTSAHSTTANSGPQAQAQSQSTTNTLHNHNGHEHDDLHQRSSEPSSQSLGGYVISAPNEASYRTAERVLRTLKQILAEEKERQESLGASENNGAVGAGADGRGAATDDELIERLEVRYQQLTLLEAREDPGDVGAEQGRKRRKRREYGEVEVEKRTLDHRQEQEQEEGQADIQGGIHRTTEGQIQGEITSDARMYGLSLNDSVELSDSTAAPVSTVTSPSVQISLPIPTQIVGPASASVAARSGVGTGTGLSFAERMRAHEREGEPDKARARKKARVARLAGPAGAGERNDGGGHGDLVALNELLPGQPLLQSHGAMASNNAGDETGAETWTGADALSGSGDATAVAAAGAPSGDVYMHDLTMTEPDQMPRIERQTQQHWLEDEKQDRDWTGVGETGMESEV